MSRNSFRLPPYSASFARFRSCATAARRAAAGDGTTTAAAATTPLPGKKAPPVSDSPWPGSRAGPSYTELMRSSGRAPFCDSPEHRAEPGSARGERAFGRLGASLDRVGSRPALRGGGRWCCRRLKRVLGNTRTSPEKIPA
jgi:hypothetical protein